MQQLPFYATAVSSAFFCCVVEEINDHKGGLRPDLSPLRITKASRAAGPPPLPLLLSIPFSEDEADTEEQLRLETGSQFHPTEE